MQKIYHWVYLAKTQKLYMMTYHDDEGYNQFFIGKILPGDFSNLAISIGKILDGGSGDTTFKYSKVEIRLIGHNNYWSLFFNNTKTANGWQNMTDTQMLPLRYFGNKYE